MKEKSYLVDKSVYTVKKKVSESYSFSLILNHFMP